MTGVRENVGKEIQLQRDERERNRKVIFKRNAKENSILISSIEPIGRYCLHDFVSAQYKDPMIKI